MDVVFNGQTAIKQLGNGTSEISDSRFGDFHVVGPYRIEGAIVVCLRCGNVVKRGDEVDVSELVQHDEKHQ